MEILTTCPACSNNHFDLLIDLGLAPQSGCLLERPGEVCPQAHLVFEFCTHCSLIRRKLLSRSELLDYKYVNRATGIRQPDYVTQIVDSLKNRGVEEPDLIVEVGANDGAFLDVVRQAGFANRLAIEPSRECAAMCAAHGHPVESKYLDYSTAMRIREQYGAAGAVICRHTLEHTPDPVELLRAMRLLLRKGGALFIEVPDARNVTRLMRVHELWEEHLHYFTLDNLPLLLSRTGLVIDEAVRIPYRGTVNLLIWCRDDSREAEQVASSTDHSADLADCRDFGAHWSKLRQRIMSCTRNWPKPVVFIGISHPQSNYLLFSGLGHQIDYLVDDDPSKIGRYAPVPQPVPIISTAQLISDYAPGTLVRGAFGYTEWMDYIGQALAPRDVLVIEPYPSSETSQVLETCEVSARCVGDRTLSFPEEKEA
jgi:SAM-dependent methyltransferase